MAYLHPDKLVSVERILTKKKARRRPVATTNPPRRRISIKEEAAGENLVHNLAAHIYATRQARGY